MTFTKNMYQLFNQATIVHHSYLNGSEEYTSTSESMKENQ